MKKHETMHYIVSYFCLASLLLSHGSIEPKPSTLEKCALGALTAIGSVAGGLLLWNGSYYSAERCIDDAREQEKTKRNEYASMLRLHQQGRQAAILYDIEKQHKSLYSQNGVRNKFPLLWYADCLRSVVDSLQYKNANLIAYEKDMRKSPSYYGYLCSQRVDVQEKTSLLLVQLKALLQTVAYTYEYEQQEYACRLEQERQQIIHFKQKLIEAQHCLSGTASDFSREFDQLVSLSVLRDFASCLCAIISNKYSTSSNCSTARSSYAALWYEERLDKAIRNLECKHRGLNSEHAQVYMLSSYRQAQIESQYTRVMARLSDQLVRLRDVRDRLRSTYFYIADLRAYECACREHNLRERERVAQERERELRDRENRQLHEERRLAQEREDQRRERKLRQKKEERARKEKEAERIRKEEEEEEERKMELYHHVVGGW